MRVPQIVVWITFLFSGNRAGLPAWVPGTISPSSPWVDRPMGRTTKNTMNQTTA